MPLLFWLLPGGLLIWILAHRHAEAQLAEHGQAGPTKAGGYYPLRERHGLLERRHELLQPAARTVLRTKVVTTADYLQHLHEATAAAQILDSIKSFAQNADVATLMQAPPEVVEALHVLSAPLEVLFAQKDLNVLGAEPPLAEDGVPSRATREAIKAIQSRFGQPPTGRMDGGTAAAIRYAVGCINSQDRAHLGAAIAGQTGKQMGA
jgi:hypothetical protein